MLYRLARHPAVDCTSIERIEVELGENAHGALRLLYRIHGDARRIVAPPLVPGTQPQRRDELWRHTCCELFICDETGAGYREYNFAPNGDWAAYGFTAYRAGMAALGAHAPRMTLARSHSMLALTVMLEDVPFEAAHARPFGLACIVETPSELSYWALAHPADRPDFHDRRSFATARDEHEYSSE